MEVGFEETGGALVVTPGVKRLDATVAPEFRTVVGARVEKARVVVLSLGKVMFMDSSGLAALISVLKRLPSGGQLRLASANSAIRSLITLTRLEKLLPVYDNVAAALHG
jgi:anti-sigma B factor antagonist